MKASTFAALVFIVVGVIGALMIVRYRAKAREMPNAPAAAPSAGPSTSPSSR